LRNIKSSSKALFHFIYKNIYINNLEVINLSCIGDSSDSSLILFDSGTTNSSLSITNLKVKYSFSNGSLIKTIGNESTITIKNSTLSNLVTYGSTIDISSIKVFFFFFFNYFEYFLFIIYIYTLN